jgi:hypothetical protein
MIGNAVPVTLGEVIGQSINQHLGAMYQAGLGNKERASKDGERKPLVA